MKSFTMQALALAVLGLAGMGTAMASCPTAVTTAGNSTPGGGGAWTSQFIGPGATFAINTPGLGGTACDLELSIGSASNSQANVKDSSPQDEKRMRGRSLINTANLTNFGVSNQTVIIHRLNDTTGPAQFTSDQLVVRLAGAATPTVRFFVSDSNPGSGVTQVAVPLPSSPNSTYRIEYDIQIGTGTTTVGGCTAMPATGGCARFWVTDAATSSSDSNPDASVTVNNSGWSGVKTSILGLQSGSPQYRANHAGTVLRFDEYDSRRQTFIGM